MSGKRECAAPWRRYPGGASMSSYDTVRSQGHRYVVMEQTAAAGRWGSATLTVVLPFDVARDLDSEPFMQGLKRWTGTEFQQRRSLGTSAVRAAAAADWFSAGRLHSAVELEDVSPTLQTNHALHLSSSPEDIAMWRGLQRWRPLTHVEDQGLVLIGLERRLFIDHDRARVDDVGYVLAHFRLEGSLLAQPQLTTARVHRPDEQLRLALQALAGLAGVSMAVDNGGRTASRTAGGHDRRGTGSTSRRMFHLVHVAPDRDVPPPPAELRTHLTWSAEQLWAHLLASGASFENAFFRPAPTAEAATADCGWIGLTLVRSDPLGLALVSTGSSPAALVADASGDSETARLQALTHTRYADLALLALRQRDWLEQHAERLAQLSIVHTPETEDARRARRREGVSLVDTEPLERLLDDVVGHEKRLMRFRNRLWFTDVPGHEDGTLVLRLLQARLGTADLLHDAITEQRDWAKIAELDVSLSRQRQQALEDTAARRADAARQREAEEAEREREREKVRRESESERRQDQQDAIANAVAALAIPSLVFGWAGLTFDTGWALGIGALIVSALATAGALAAYRRAQPRSGNRPDPTADDQEPGRATARPDGPSDPNPDERTTEEAGS